MYWIIFISLTIFICGFISYHIMNPDKLLGGTIFTYLKIGTIVFTVTALATYIYNRSSKKK